MMTKPEPNNTVSRTGYPPCRRRFAGCFRGFLSAGVALPARRLPQSFGNRMNTDDLIVEARARIIWGDEPSSVRYFLTSNGMSAADADARLRDVILERNAEIRKLGVRDVLIGVALVGGAGIFFYSLYGSSHMPDVSVRAAKGYGVLALMAVYGLWRLINGIIRLIRPKIEHGSIPDISE